MNKVILMGRLTRDPVLRYRGQDQSTAVANYTLAVDRRQSKEQEADFIPCVAFNKSAEFADKYFRKGMKVVISGRIQTGSYTDREGRKVYTTDVIIEEQEFAESRKALERLEAADETAPETAPDGFMNIPEGIDEELPFT